MSKSLCPLLLVFMSFVGGAFVEVRAEDLLVSIGIEPGPHPVAVLRGRFQGAGAKREFRFLTGHAGNVRLDERISRLKAADEKGQTINLHTVSPGHFVAERDITEWSYSVDIGPGKSSSWAAHLSWAAEVGSVIFLDDLLPQGYRSARVVFTAPAGWDIKAEGALHQQDAYEVPDIEKAVFHLGREIRHRSLNLSGSEVEIKISGEWFFSDEEATDMVKSVFTHYLRLFGTAPSRKAHVTIRPFPFSMFPGHWEGSSRGSSVFIVSSDMPFRTQSLQRLHEQLRHEIFHLWIPNGLNLTGRYDWFYEGFAIYQSLKMGVEVNRIRFDDMLETLSMAQGIASRSRNTSLIDASKSRWSGPNTEIYAKGMLAAFAVDLSLLASSNGRRSVSDLLKTIYERHNHKAGDLQDGNETIMSVLRAHEELVPIGEAAVMGSGPLDWSGILRPAGLELQGSRIVVSERLSGRQRGLLDRLGYNNWRRLQRR